MVFYPLDCGKQYDLDDGKAHFTNDPTTYNHTLQLECNEGHNLHGDEYAVCLSNGTWSRTAQCIIKGILIEPAHKIMALFVLRKFIL